MRIVTLNANGIRSAQRKGFFEWLEREGVRFRFRDFTKRAVLLMLLSIAICHVYLYLRYLR